MGITISKELQAALDSKGLTLTGRFMEAPDGKLRFELSNGYVGYNEGDMTIISTFEQVNKFGDRGDIQFLSTLILKAIKKHLNNQIDE